MTAWLATPTTHVFCPVVRPEDDAPCHLLVHSDGVHVAGDGEGWTDGEIRFGQRPDPTDRAEQERQGAELAEVYAPNRQ